MKTIILAAGQGTRLRPLTDHQPKCMVEVCGKSIVRRQIETMTQCGIKEEDITIICGYKHNVLRDHLQDTKVQFIDNEAFETTNMVCSLMCGKEMLSDEVIVSYGDIIYSNGVLNALLNVSNDLTVVVDDGWLPYWQSRCDDPTSDAETLKFGAEGEIIEIGQKTKDIKEIESQYIGLMKYSKLGAKQVLSLADTAKKRSETGTPLWRTHRNYHQMYMTDLLQGLIDEGQIIRPLHINRGWFEVDNPDDLAVAEKNIDALQ